MKKTINISLAGIHFHIEEDAYQKLHAYLESIRKSLKSEGDEILQEIEARIAELFAEKITSENHVVSIKHVEAVIEVMGQPEDYEMDDDAATDTEPQSTREKIENKRLFRDVDNKFLGGVLSGFGHYFNVDPVWLRLIAVLLILIGVGSPILVYLVLWIVVPPAITTSDKLKMTGEPINISNIEKKVKESFESVANTVKNQDYKSFGSKLKSGIQKFLDFSFKILNIVFVLLVKLIGSILIILAITLFIGLIISAFFINYIPLKGYVSGHDYYNFIFIDSVPIWVTAVLYFISVAIPLFVLFVLGLRLLANNIRPVNTTLKILLFVIWLFALIGIGYIVTKQHQETAFSAHSTVEEILPITAQDTLSIDFRGSSEYDLEIWRKSGMHTRLDANGNTVIYSNNIQLNLRPTRDSLAKIIIDKKAKGNHISTAKSRAEAIVYRFDINDKSLAMDGFFVTEAKNSYRDQEVEITLFFPEETILQVAPRSRSFIGANSRFRGKNNRETHYYRASNNEIICLDCPLKAQEPTVTKDSLPDSDWETEVQKRFKNI